MIFRRKRTHEEVVPPEEKRQLASVKRRLDRVESRMYMVETQLKIMRRDTK